MVKQHTPQDVGRAGGDAGGEGEVGVRNCG